MPLIFKSSNTSRSFSEQHGEAYMRVLVHFLVSWHKQRLELQPSPLMQRPQESGLKAMELLLSHQTQQSVNPYQQQKWETGLCTFFVSHFYSQCELFWGFPGLPGLSTAWSLEGERQAVWLACSDINNLTSFLICGNNANQPGWFWSASLREPCPGLLGWPEIRACVRTGMLPFCQKHQKGIETFFPNPTGTLEIRDSSRNSS